MAKCSVWAKRENDKAVLRVLFKPGSKVHTVIRHVSRSGMARTISVLAVDCATGDVENVSYRVARALGWRFDRDRDGVKVNGCGMDMAYHLVYELSATLYTAADAATCGAQSSGYVLRKVDV